MGVWRRCSADGYKGAFSVANSNALSLEPEPLFRHKCYSQIPLSIKSFTASILLSLNVLWLWVSSCQDPFVPAVPLHHTAHGKATQLSEEAVPRANNPISCDLAESTCAALAVAPAVKSCVKNHVWLHRATTVSSRLSPPGTSCVPPLPNFPVFQEISLLFRSQSPHPSPSHTHSSLPAPQHPGAALQRQLQTSAASLEQRGDRQQGTGMGLSLLLDN